MADYVASLREKVGSMPLFLNAAGAIVLNPAGEILLQRRGKGEKADAWSLPGGIMEIGETARQAAEREVKEETGLTAIAGEFVGIYSSPQLVTYPNGDQCQMMTQIFVCAVTGGDLKADGDETLELRYFPLSERPRLFRPHLERAVSDFEAGKRGISD